MKAAVLEHYGSPDQFVIKNVDVPELGDGQVLIRNRASSVNPVDVLIRQGALKLVTGLFGDQITGSDFSGTVVTSNHSQFKAGDEVFGCMKATSGHAYAELVAVEADTAAIKPANLSFTEAASLALTSLTAWQALLDEGDLKAGDQVLINGCTGGVGCAAVQIAKALGATVTGTCRAEHVEAARELGCDVVINYETDPIPANGQYQLIFDTAAKLTLSDVEKSLTDDGLLVTIKPHADDVKSAVTSVIDLVRSRMKLLSMNPNTADLAKLTDLIDQGKLRPYVAQTFPLERIGEAHQLQEKGGFVGKVAIEIA